LPLMLQACESSPQLSTSVKPPASALQVCDEAPKPKLGDDVNRYVSSLLDSYYVCVYRHDALVRWFK
jgi:hypothetical protein